MTETSQTESFYLMLSQVLLSSLYLGYLYSLVMNDDDDEGSFTSPFNHQLDQLDIYVYARVFYELLFGQMVKSWPV